MVSEKVALESWHLWTHMRQGLHKAEWTWLVFVFTVEVREVTDPGQENTPVFSPPPFFSDPLFFLLPYPQILSSLGMN